MLGDLITSGAELFFTPEAILLTALGCLAGLVIGVLPGLGPLMGIILIASTTVLASNLRADILYAVVDPRIRYN